MDQQIQESYYTAQMLEEVPVGIALLDARHFRIITANRCFRALFMNSVMERKQIDPTTEDRSLLDFFSAPNLPFALELFQTVKQTGQVYHGQEFPALHPERGMTYWNGSITPIYDAQGQINQLLITASDVTEQARARLQAKSSQNEHQKIETEVQRLATLEAVAKGVSKELLSENIARTAIEALVTALNPICACIHVAQPLTRELHLAHIYIDEQDLSAQNLGQMVIDQRNISYDSPHWIARARQYREPILLHSLNDIPRASKERPTSELAAGSYICIPLWFQEYFEGTLVMLFREPLTTNGLFVRILKDCCPCISAALTHSRLLGEVECERKRLRAVLDHLPEGVFLVEADKRCISYANKAAAHILDTSREHLQGMPLDHIYALSPNHFSLVHQGKESNKVYIPSVRALAGETSIGTEVQFIRPNGKVITLLVSTAPMRNEAGSITGSVSIFQDITVRKSTEQQKSDFLSIASHELRTPTTAIQGFAEILQMFAEHQYDPGESQTLQIIQNILEQSTRLTHLINEMLDISHIEHEQLILQPARHDLIATVKRTVANMAVTDRQHPITTVFQGIDPDEALIGIFDEERLLQVLNNFISNAMKYSQAGSIVEVGLRYAKDQPDKVLLWVHDSGIGIPPEDLPHIFERFHRGRNVDRSISGLGIGLYLAREIIRRHGGSIWAESQEGKESTFSIELPLHPSKSAASSAEATQAKGEA